MWQVLISVLRCYWATQPQSVDYFEVQIIIIECIVFDCRVLWAGFNSDSLPILQSLSSGHTGKMVKKVCPCNQLCSNYLSFWSFLPPSIPSTILALAPPALPPALKCPLDLICQIWDQFNSVISATVTHRSIVFSILIVKDQITPSLKTEMTELTSHHRFKLTVHAPASSHTHSHTLTHLNSYESLCPPPFPLLPRHVLRSWLHCPEFHAAAVSHDSASLHSYFPPFYIAWHDSFCELYNIVFTGYSLHIVSPLV